MSFRCQFCNEAQPACVCPVRITTKTRPSSRGFGFEIAEEKMACKECAKEHGPAVEESETATTTLGEIFGAKIGDSVEHGVN